VVISPKDEEAVNDAAPQRAGRRIVRSDTPFRAYDLEGPIQPDMSWLPVSYDRTTGNGCYLMRMQPGAVTVAHEHPGVEDFLMLEGELIDDDGVVFRPGDFVSYAAGTWHNSRTETGCLIAVFEWGMPAPAGST
jgi:mannose-6-phosphate isomerase-like protein (cupin superfamily)